MNVRVHRINIPAWSTIGYGYGVDSVDGKPVTFTGDHRPMRSLGEELRRVGAPIEAYIEPWQIIGGTHGEEGSPAVC